MVYYIEYEEMIVFLQSWIYSTKTPIP